MQFGIHLVRAGVLTPDQFVEVLDRQLRERPTLGELAIETRKLSMRRVFAILSAQAVANKPFGQTAIEQGYLTRSDLVELLALQTERCKPFSEVIVELGLLDQASLNRHLQEFRAQTIKQSLSRNSAADDKLAEMAGECS